MDITVKAFKAVSPYKNRVVLIDCVERVEYDDAHDIPQMYDDDIVFAIESDGDGVAVTIYHGANSDYFGGAI